MKKATLQLSKYFTQKLAFAFHQAFTQIADVKHAVENLVSMKNLFLTSAEDYIEEGDLNDLFNEMSRVTNKWYNTAYTYGLSGSDNAKYLNQITNMIEKLINWNWGSKAQILDTRAFPALRDVESKLKNVVPTTVAPQKPASKPQETSPIGRRVHEESGYEEYEPVTKQEDMMPEYT